MSDGPKLIVLGSVTIDDGVSPAFDIPDNLSPDEIRAILERVEAKRAADAVEETRRLRAMFLPEGEEKGERP
jgi:hypothetical protein